jgi:hypothetical protein
MVRREPCAFAAGLVLEDVIFKAFVNRGERPLEELLVAMVVVRTMATPPALKWSLTCRRTAATA